MGAITDCAVEAQVKVQHMTGVTIRMLVGAIVRTAAFRQLRNGSAQAHGKQSLKKLNMQNKELQHMDVSSEDLKQVRRQMNKYKIDFSVTKDKDTGIYHVFFKAQDADRLYLGMEKSALEFARSKDRTPMQDQLAAAQAEATAREQTRQVEKAAEKTMQRSMEAIQ